MPGASDDRPLAWLDGLPVEDRDAAPLIYDACFDRLVATARRALAATPRRDIDEEDIASSVLSSFFRGIDDGRFSGQLSRAQLWGLLLTIARRKVARLHRRRFTLRRGGGKERGECDLGPADASGTILDRLAAVERCPMTLAAVRETLRMLLDGLADPLAERVLMLRLAGETHGAIATHLGCAERTVERKMKKVQHVWLIVNRE
ncbi:ECF sigma factor [Pirellulimonas nuda]|uniref:ECF sigma factor n=1 Tax=Pirellulimonas nuda TaxID=2528009 RepID=A0A518DE83_9BACT|nr:ECF-type sigma factor [Pirellulimonas nuda]QDU89742.1 ECF sigma factor [Pirellulimonas nuda]